MKRLLFILVAAPASLMPQIAWSAGEAIPGTEAPDFFITMLRLAGGLILLIGLLYLLVYILRRIGPAGSGVYGDRDIIRIVGTKALAPKKYIALVEIGDSILTLGITPDRITRLDKFPAENLKAHNQTYKAEKSESGFAGRLKSLMGKPKSAYED